MPAAGLEDGVTLVPRWALHWLSYATRHRYQDDLLDTYLHWALARYIGLFEHRDEGSYLPALMLSEAGQRIKGNQRRVTSEEMGIATRSGPWNAREPAALSATPSASWPAQPGSLPASPSRAAHQQALQSAQLSGTTSCRTWRSTPRMMRNPHTASIRTRSSKLPGSVSGTISRTYPGVCSRAHWSALPGQLSLTSAGTCLRSTGGLPPSCDADSYDSNDSASRSKRRTDSPAGRPSLWAWTGSDCTSGTQATQRSISK